MEVPRLGVQLELQLPAYNTATSDLRATSATYTTVRGNVLILNPLSEARDGTRNLMVLSRIRFPCAMMGTPSFFLSFFLIPYSDIQAMKLHFF